MSDLISRIAAAQKELKALKAGFGGNEDRFFPAVATSATFLRDSNDRPIVIEATFEKNDFPQLYAAVSMTTVGPPIILQYKAFDRKTLYSWRMTEKWGTIAHYTINCMLLSQRAPLTFTCTVE